MNMKLCFIRVLEVWSVTTLLWRIVSGPGKLLRQEPEQRSLPRMTFRNGGHQGRCEAVIDDGATRFSFPRLAANKL